MPFPSAKNVFKSTWIVVAFFSVARCDKAVVCSLCGTGTAASTPIRVNILDESSGFYLWVNPQSKLTNGAVNIGDGSSLFEIHQYGLDDPTYFWIKTLAFQSVTKVAANFSSDPVLDIASLIIAIHRFYIFSFFFFFCHAGE